MNRFRNILKIAVLIAISLVMVTSCDSQIEPGLYVPDDIWSVGGMTYYKFSEAMAAVEAENSKAIDSRNTIKLLRDVGSFERGEGFFIAESFSGEVEINLGGHEYWFYDDIDYFLEIRGGEHVNITNGTTIIDSGANPIPKALIVSTDVVKLEKQKIDDRRPVPLAIEILNEGKVDLSSGSDIVGDVTVSGGGTLGVSGGSLKSEKITVDSNEEGKEAALNITGGTIEVSKLDAGKNSDIKISEADESVKTDVKITNILAESGNSGEKAKLTVSGGSFAVAEKLEAKQNSEINILKNTESTTSSAPVVEIKDIVVSGENEENKASVNLSTSATIGTLSSSGASTVSITKTEGDTENSVSIGTIESTGSSSSIDIGSGVNVTLKDSVSAEDSSTITISEESVVNLPPKLQNDEKVSEIIPPSIVQTYHEFGDWVVEIDPTCTEEGLKARECVDEYCQKHKSEGYREEVVLSALGHDPVKVEAVAATCLADGNTLHWRCSRCSELFSDENCQNSTTADDVKISKIDHKYENYSTDSSNHWKECIYGCGTKIEVAAHTFGEWADSEDSTTKIRVCSTCGYIESQTHTHDLQKVAGVAATCTATGVSEHWKCTICGKLFSDELGTTTITKASTVLSALGHNLSYVVAVAPTCETAGNVAHYHCSRCSKYFSDKDATSELASVIVSALGHDYGEPVWSWKEDLSQATATFTCANDSSHVETLTATSTNAVTTSATCTADGVRTYTAKVTFLEKEYTATTTQAIDKLGHDYGEPVWSWNDDLSQATATFTCSHDSSHVETLTATSTNAVTTAVTCTTDGVRTYTAKVTFLEKEYTATTTQAITKLGHDYGEPVWVWNDDLSQATATFTCSHDSSHTETRTIGSTNAVTTAATCTATGVRTYTAKVTFQGAEYTSTATETIAATGHSPASTWSSDGTGHWHACNNGCDAKLDYATHTVSSEWVTTDSDYHYHVCSVCGGGEFNKAAHTFGSWVPTEAESYRTCSVCSRIEYEDHVHSMTATAAVPATCTEAGHVAYWYCDLCNKYFLDSKGVTETTLADTVTAAIGHSYGDPSWSWNADLSQATATFTCSHDSSHVETCSASSTNAITTSATCTVDGVRTYTAKVTFQGKEYTGTTTQAITKLGHDYGAPSWSWSSDNSQATATFTCSHDSTHVETSTVASTSAVTTAATCTTDGVRTYTAKVTFQGTEYTDTKTQTITKLGHDYGTPSWSWNSDNSQATATFTCSHDSTHVQTFTATSTNAVTTAVTCTTDGVRTYTAKVTFQGTEYTDTKTQTITKLGHDYGAPSWSWNSDNSQATATFTCSHDSSHVETSTVASTNAVTTPVTCTTDGVRTYTAKVTFQGTEYTDTKTQTITKLGHDYGTPSWSWNSDNSQATATFTCSHDSTHVQTLTATSTNAVTTAVTCTTDGVRTYTAKVTFQGTEYTGTKTQTITKLGHAYGAPSWSWNSDNSQATATFTCSHDSSHVETSTVASTNAVTTPVTCTTDGVLTYTAKVTFQGTEYTDTKTQTITKLGHDYGTPTWSWNSDYSKATLSSVCSHDSSHIQSVTVDTTEVIHTAPTCTATGSATYSATATLMGTEYSVTKNVTLAAKGHTYNGYKHNASGHWQECTVCGYTTTPVAHSEESVTYTADGTHLTITWGCKVCGNESGTPIPLTTPSTGAFELVLTFNGVVATKNEEGVWTLSVSESKLTELGATASKTVWVGGNNVAIISGEASIKVTVTDGVSNGTVYARYYDNAGNYLGGGYAMLPGKAVSTN